MITNPEIRAFEGAFRAVPDLVPANDLKALGCPVVLEDHRDASPIETLNGLIGRIDAIR